MKVEKQIREYLSSLQEHKRSDMQALHGFMLKIMPGTKLCFLDGKNSEGKIVTNPNIGYGHQVIKYADGTTREFYQVRISPNTTGISVYVLGIDDKTYLAKTYGDKIGKATVTGYCIKFRKLEDIDLDVLRKAVADGLKATAARKKS